MIGVAGDVLLMLAGALACLQALAPHLAKWRNDERYRQLIYPAATVQTGALLAAMGLLILAYAISDFSLLNVALNSHTDKPLIYKLTGSWGNHEGSMLLWTCLLSGAGWLAAQRPRWRDDMLAAHGLLIAGLCAFVLFTSNPFVTIEPAPANGQGLNPLLQDIGLALHPPLLYAGYVGFGVVFAYALAAMRLGTLNREWARLVQPLIGLSFGCLTIGIGLGSWWAYRELGWGGWWFWDPVENVSLLPWLSGVALMHANLTLMRRGQLMSLTLFLALLTFALSLLGTFIVRSGILVSVHSFATDPARGLFILAYVGAVVGTGLWRFASYRSSDTAEQEPLSLLSRQGLLLLQSVFLLTATATILLAILYPSVLPLVGLPGVTVGAPYFNQTVLPLMVPPLLLAALAPLLPWQRASAILLWRAMRLPLLAALLVCVLSAALFVRDGLLMAGGLGLAAWLAAGTAQATRRQLAAQGRWTAGTTALAVSHGGMALLVAAITFSALQSETYDMVLAKGERKTIAPIELHWMQEWLGVGANHGFRRAQVAITKDNRQIATLTPELRHYPERAMQTTEAAVDSGWLRDVYLVSNLQDNPDHLGFTLHLNAAMRWLWIAFALVASGGFIIAIRRTPHHDR